MVTKELLDKAMKLKPAERLALVEALIKSLDQADENPDRIWAEEAKRRLEAYRNGKLKTIGMEDIFGID